MPLTKAIETVNAAIYARKSDDNAAGIDRQVSLASKFIADKGWTLGEVFTDNDVSGTVTDRPGLSKLLAAIQHGPLPFNALVVMESSRLSRDMADALALQTCIRRGGVRMFHYQTGTELLLDTATNKLTASSENYSAEAYAEQVKAKTIAALRDKFLRGHVVGRAPFGYVDTRIGEGKASHVTRAINETEARTVRRIFEEIAAGRGFQSLAKLLRSEGLPAPTAAGWAASGLKAILANEHYVGRLTYGKTAWRKVDVVTPTGETVTRKVKENADESAVPSIDRPDLRIVPDELWKAAHDRLAASRAAYLAANADRLTAAPDLRGKYLLSGFLHCGACGARLIAIEGGRSYLCSRAFRRGRSACPTAKRLNREHLDAAIREVVEKTVLNPETVGAIVERMIARHAAEPDTVAQERADIEAAIADAQAELGRLVAAIAKAGDSPTLLAAIREKELEVATARAHLEHAEGLAKSADKWSDPAWLAEVQRAAAERRVSLSGKNGEELPVDVLRGLLRLTIGRVTVTPGKGGDATFDIGIAFRDIFGPDADLTTAVPGRGQGEGWSQGEWWSQGEVW